MKNIFLSLCLVISLTGFSQIPSYVSTNGLIGYWPFNGNANDASINLNNGSVTGASLTTDRFGNLNSAYSFNGTSNYIMVPNTSGLSGFNDITISAWVNMSQFSGIQGVVTKWFFTLNCGSNTDNYNASFSSNSINFATNNNNLSGFFCPQTFTSGDLNVWKHFVFVSNSTTGISIYINGVLAGTAATSGGICSSTNPLYFGAVNPTTRFLNGKLDDIGIWNRALTACEISKLYLGSTVNPTSSNSGICSGNSATLTAAVGGLNYLWNTAATTSVIVVNPTVTTTYTVIQTNTLTSCSYTGIVTQSVSVLNLSAITSNSIICAGDASTLTVNGNATSYFWNTSAMSPSIVVNPTITTTYTVFGTNAATGCTNTAMVTQNVSVCTGIKTNSPQNATSIYPNPSKGNFVINSDISFSRYEITNMFGQLVAVGSIYDNRIMEENIPAGIYNINLVSDKITIRKKIIIE
jgi:Concanavalin A-like lectin/glucanases superfamily/Secretion system C-terminal sorting domain